MASPVQRVVSPRKSIQTEKIVDFSPERIKAPFLLRSAALIIDYMTLLVLPVGWLVLSKLLSETGTVATVGTAIWVAGLLLFVANFFLLPLWRGQTLGKMLLGLTILRTDGRRVDLAGVIRRNLLGYAVTALTLGIGFLIAGVNTSGRALHDMIAGTVVVRGRKTHLATTE